MRRLKRSTALLQSSRNRLRGDRAWPTRPAFTRTKSRGGSVVSAGWRVLEECGRRGCRYSADSAEICSRLVEAENVRPACRDACQINIARRDMRIMPTARRLLPLLSCNGAEAQEYEHYGYSQCHDRFGREFHYDYVRCSDALRRNSCHPPPELNEVML